MFITATILFSAPDDADRILAAEHSYISFQQTRVNRIDALYGAHVPRVYEDCLRKGNFDEAMDAIEAGACVINTRVRNVPEPQRRAFGAPPARLELEGMEAAGTPSAATSRRWASTGYTRSS